MNREKEGRFYNSFYFIWFVKGGIQMQCKNLKNYAIKRENEMQDDYWNIILVTF